MSKEETPEVAPAGTDLVQVQELRDYAVKAVESMRKQQEELAGQIERQVGFISAFDMILQSKVEETLEQIRGVVEKSQE